MKIQLIHPIEHDHMHYSRGIHDLPKDLAELFLTFRDGDIPIAIKASTRVEMGTVAEAADFKLSKLKAKEEK